MTHHSNLIGRDRAHLWHPYTQMKGSPDPVPIVRGEGVYLYTEDGRRLLDGISSWWVNIHGHSHPRLNEALAKQANELEHVLFAGYTHKPAIELAEGLTAVLPAGLNRVFYSDNGSTAVEVAVKMAYQYWHNRGRAKKQRLVALHHAYHGDTVGAMSSSEASVFTRAFQPLLFPVERAHAPYCHHCPVGLRRSECHIECLDSLKDLLEKHHETVTAVIVEPMLQGAGGMIVWPAEFLAGVRRLCTDYDTLMIADEVLTGFGRTGRMFASEHAGTRPDIICLSKALTGGYLPLAATVTTDAVYDAFLDDDRSRALFHGHSYTANPLSCAVGVASLKLFEDGKLLERVQAMEVQFRRRLEPMRALPIVSDVRGIGGVGVVELKTEGGYLDRIGPRLTAEFQRRGMVMRPLGSILYFMPPYVITEAEVDWAFDQIVDVLSGLS